MVAVSVRSTAPSTAETVANWGSGAAGSTRVGSVVPVGRGTVAGATARTDWPASNRLMSSRISDAVW